MRIDMIGPISFYRIKKVSKARIKPIKNRQSEKGLEKGRGHLLGLWHLFIPLPGGIRQEDGMDEYEQEQHGAQSACPAQSAGDRW